MKQYIITQAQVTVLQWVADSLWLARVQNVIDSLKPIEPMSDEELYELISKSPHISFAREIEAHILGEKT